MYWFQPPSMIRRAGAVLLIVAAVAWDLNGTTQAPYPVAARSIAAGEQIVPESVEWIDLPAGALPAVDPIGATAARGISVGEPLSASSLMGDLTAPDDWWTVPIALGTLAAPGDEALLVVADPPLSVIGLVIEAQIGDPYALGHRPASVAVPASAAPIVAAAEQQGLLVAAVRRATGER